MKHLSRHDPHGLDMQIQRPSKDWGSVVGAPPPGAPLRGTPLPGDYKFGQRPPVRVKHTRALALGNTKAEKGPNLPLWFVLFVSGASAVTTIMTFDQFIMTGPSKRSRQQSSALNVTRTILGLTSAGLGLLHPLGSATTSIALGIIGKAFRTYAGETVQRSSEFAVGARAARLERKLRTESDPKKRKEIQKALDALRAAQQAGGNVVKANKKTGKTGKTGKRRFTVVKPTAAPAPPPTKTRRGAFKLKRRP